MPRTRKVVRKPAKKVVKPARKAVKASEIIVKVAKTGGRVGEVCLNGERTVEDALNAAAREYGLEWDEGNRIRVNSEPCELDDELSNGDIVTVSGKIKGGR